jgi:16S rRNA (cytosine1402-N4)-methyltransferase
MPNLHIPVLAREVVELLDPREGEIFVDATVGMGGHAKLLLEHLGESDKLIGIDTDGQALQLANKNLESYRNQLKLVHGNFRNLADLVSECGYQSVDGILLDIGVSSFQIDTPERGFSFNNLAQLDMRMDLGGYRTAGDIVNNYSYLDLVRIFKEYGEESKAEIFAKRITEARRKNPIETTMDLVEIIAPQGQAGRGKIHPATKVFQALRIEVNDELGALQEVLPQAVDLLKPGGRLAVITFHSLEDRLVKNFLRYQVDKDRGELINKKVVVPTWAERQSNRRSRSAKLRVFEKH